ncbi:MAG: hypothetical protein AAF573_17420, partial [Bacteroidota bacterium]
MLAKRILNPPCPAIVPYPPSGPITSALEEYAILFYDVISQWVYLESTTTTEYDELGQNPLTSTTTYEYSSQHLNPIVTTYIAPGVDQTTTTLYADDVPASYPLRAEMIARGMTGVPLETNTIGTVTSGNKIEYKLHNNKVLPEKNYQVRGSAGMQLIGTLFYDDADHRPDRYMKNHDNQYQYINWETGIKEGLISSVSYGIMNTGYGYNDLRQLTSISNTDGTYTTFDYDGLQRLEKTEIYGLEDVLKSTSTVDYQIGAVNQISNTTVYGDAPTQNAVQNFDGLGRLTSASLNGLPTEQYIYDEFNRVAEKMYLPGSLTGLGYEPSPLNRLTSETYPDGSSIQIAYGAEDGLYKTTTTDENLNDSETLTDALGRSIKMTDALEQITSYTYDNFGNIWRAYPPNFGDTQEAYEYEYDNLNRLIQKKIPGGGTHSFYYNLKDQLVASQTSNEMVETIYDDYGRPLQTGKLSGAPTDPENITIAELYTETIYDYPSILPSDYPIATSDNCFLETAKGKVVGSKVKILGSEDWLYSSICYDRYGRALVTNSTNHLEGNDMVTSNLNLADLPKSIVREHTTSLDSKKIVEGFIYDNLLRPQVHSHGIGDIDEVDVPTVTLSNSIYNNINQLVTKNVGTNPGISGYLQRIDYSYNTRGWLTHIKEIEDQAVPQEEVNCNNPQGHCPTLCDYSVTLELIGDRGIVDIIHGEWDPSTQTTTPTSMSGLNYVYYHPETDQIEPDIEQWLIENDYTFGDVTVNIIASTFNSRTIDLIITQTNLKFRSVTIGNSPSTSVLFDQTNCSGDDGNNGGGDTNDEICDLCTKRGYDCDRCPFTRLPDNCEVCTDMDFTDCSNCQPQNDLCGECANLGYTDCTKCPLTIDQVRPLSIKVEYNHPSLSGMDGSSVNAALVRVTQVSQRLQHNKQIKIAKQITNTIVGDGVPTDADMTHILEVDVSDQWVDAVSLASVVANVEDKIMTELEAAGITNGSIQQNFAQAVALEASKEWGNTTGLTPTPGSVSNPDLFSMQLTYDDGHAMIDAPIQRNGNISGMIWQVAGRSPQSYSLTYDPINRLEQGIYQERTGVDELSTDDRYGVTLTYDNVGNIETLLRNGAIDKCTAPTGDLGFDFGVMDQLTYDYVDKLTGKKSNRLQRITETANVDHGFKGTGGQYEYDAQGNMTYDPRSGATITYNHFNLPKMITLQDGQIQITYDATGAKLKKEVTGAENYTIYYLGGIEYRDD